MQELTVQLDNEAKADDQWTSGSADERMSSNHQHNSQSNNYSACAPMLFSKVSIAWVSGPQKQLRKRRAQGSPRGIHTY
jgi:hypothetical protein